MYSMAIVLVYFYTPIYSNYCQFLKSVLNFWEQVIQRVEARFISNILIIVPERLFDEVAGCEGTACDDE